jgi:hypothetical protein
VRLAKDDGRSSHNRRQPRNPNLAEVKPR